MEKKNFITVIINFSMEPAGVQGAASLPLSVVGGDTDALKRILASSPHTLKQSTLLKKEVCIACDKPFTSFFINTGYKCLGKMVWYLFILYL